MSKPQPTSFRPRWSKELSQEALRDLEDEPWIGSQPIVFTRITTRVLPARDIPALPAVALIEILEQTQKLARFAAYDVAKGVNPDFADLRSIGPDLIEFSTLTVEPFGEGSFVIPARLESPPIERPEDGDKTVTTDQLAERFRTILENLTDRDKASNVSIGALQAVDALRQVLKRNSAEVEYTTADSFSEERSFKSEPNFWNQVTAWVQHRRPTSEALEELSGRVTSLDIEQGKLLLTVEVGQERVKGSFPKMLHPKLLKSLDRRVKLFGKIERKGKRPRSIYIQDSEFIDDEIA